MTTTASVLAPRLIVKLPAIGQRSMRHRSVIVSFENISKLAGPNEKQAGHVGRDNPRARYRPTRSLMSDGRLLPRVLARRVRPRPAAVQIRQCSDPPSV